MPRTSPFSIAYIRRKNTHSRQKKPMRPTEDAAHMRPLRAATGLRHGLTESHSSAASERGRMGAAHRHAWPRTQYICNRQSATAFAWCMVWPTYVLCSRRVREHVSAATQSRRAAVQARSQRRSSSTATVSDCASSGAPTTSPHAPTSSKPAWAASSRSASGVKYVFHM